MKNIRKSFHSCAFSLVEVTLALGLISYALVALLGLLAVGISSSRESSRETVIAQIVPDVLAGYDGVSNVTLNYTFDGKQTATPADAFFEIKLTTQSGKSILDGTGDKLRLVTMSISSPKEPTFKKVIQSSLFIP